MLTPQHAHTPLGCQVVDMVHLLLLAGAEAEATTKAGEGAVRLALKAGHHLAALALLAAGGAGPAVDLDANPELMEMATAAGQTTLAEELTGPATAFHQMLRKYSQTVKNLGFTAAQRWAGTQVDTFRQRFKIDRASPALMAIAARDPGLYASLHATLLHSLLLRFAARRPA